MIHLSMVGAIDSITVSPELDNTDTYLDPNDGLLHCSKCRGVRQTVLKWDGHEKKVKCLCACEEAAEKEREDARRARERQYAIRNCGPMACRILPCVTTHLTRTLVTIRSWTRPGPT